MTQIIIAECAHCKSSFETKKHSPRKYCKVSHYHAAMRGVAKRQPKYETCPQCNKEFDNESDSTFCSRTCYDQSRTDIIKARIKTFNQTCGYCSKQLDYSENSAASKQYCDDGCRRLDAKAKPKHCKECGTWFTPVKYSKQQNKLISANAYEYCSSACGLKSFSTNEERKAKISKAFTGEKHPNYLGGLYALSNKSFRGYGWQATARSVRHRDNHRCRRCGKTEIENGRALDVHHIRPYRITKDNSKSNLVSLCQTCHKQVEWKFWNHYKKSMMAAYGEDIIKDLYRDK